MPAKLTSDQVWQELARDRHIYICTWKDAWKARHIAANPRASLTVTIPKRIPFMPWVRIPDATITLQGEATLHAPAEVPAGIPQALIHGLVLGPGDPMPNLAIIRIRPVGEFLTYGVGVPMSVMRRPEEASGRVAV